MLYCTVILYYTVHTDIECLNFTTAENEYPQAECHKINKSNYMYNVHQLSVHIITILTCFENERRELLILVSYSIFSLDS